jgi:hypothetical protein
LGVPDRGGDGSLTRSTDPAGGLTNEYELRRHAVAPVEVEQDVEEQLPQSAALYCLEGWPLGPRVPAMVKPVSAIGAGDHAV